MDLLLQLGFSLVGAERLASFNPCFNGPSTSTVENEIAEMRKWVSILVLMDLLLQPVSPDPLSGCRVSFNPCFNGPSTSTL